MTTRCAEEEFQKLRGGFLVMASTAELEEVLFLGASMVHVLKAFKQAS